MKTPAIDGVYDSLRKKYLLVYLLASFADWLQGPYLYCLYASYGYSQKEISLLYGTGFAGGMISGLIIGHYADTFGRKRLCVIYSLTTIVTCCATSTTKNYSVLMIARAFGGASTCILFSTFESWYIGQHLSRYKLDSKLMGNVFTKSTLYNGFLAIFAGFLSSFMADTLGYGPSSPLLLAIPVSILSAFFCLKLWPEYLSGKARRPDIISSVTESLNILLFSEDRRVLLLLGTSQSIFETVLYVFVFLWTPVLQPMGISQGFVFGIFMLCVMIGSAVSSFLASAFHLRRQYLLCCSIALATFSIFLTTLGLYFQDYDNYKDLGNIICLISFSLFELAVGIYYPIVSYLRGIVVPESHRASIANWFRLPMNFFICFGLLYIGMKIPKFLHVFSFCSFALLVAFICSLQFARFFTNHFDDSSFPKPSQSFVV